MNRFAGQITPRTLAAVCTCFMLALTALYFAGALVPFRVVGMIGPLMAYGIALWLCTAIAAEYRLSRELRVAWVLLGVCAAVSMARHIFDTPLMDLVWPGYWAGPWSQWLRELLAAAALTALAAGILTMAEAFRRMKLGFSLRRPDLAAIAGVLLLLSLVLYFHNDLAAARSSPLLAGRAQFYSQIMFSVAGIGCVLLLRISKQMGGGKLAIAMGWIIAHIVLRAILVLATALQTHLHTSPPLSDLLHSVISMGAIWMFALAAASRYQLSATAARQAAKWGIAAHDRLVDVTA